jgi:hypothetical protein
MNTGATMDAKCAAAMRNLDALLSGGLPEPSAGAVRDHLNGCPTCSGELEVRRRMRQRLKEAVASEQASPYLGVRVMAQVRSEAQRPLWLQRARSLSAVAAVLLVTVSGVIAYQLGHLRYSAESQNAYIASLVTRVGHVLGAGLSDHVHCSVYRKYPKEAPSLEKLHSQIGPEYKDLVDVVRAQMPAGFRIFIAHECGYMDREFIHVGLKSDSNLISLVLAKRRPGETYRNSDLMQVLSQGGLKVYGASVQRFEIAGFETDGHLAWVVSDVSQRHTRELLIALAPGIRSILAAKS